MSGLFKGTIRHTKHTDFLLAMPQVPNREGEIQKTRAEGGVTVQEELGFYGSTQNQTGMCVLFGQPGKVHSHSAPSPPAPSPNS